MSIVCSVCGSEKAVRGYCVSASCASNANSDYFLEGGAEGYALLYRAGSESQGWMEGVCGINMDAGVLLSRESWRREDGVWTPEVALSFVEGMQIDKDITPRQLVGLSLMKAALTTALTGVNNDLVFTARKGGVEGNAITVAYTISIASVLGASVSGDDITITLKSNAVAAVWNPGAVTVGTDNTIAFGGVTITIAAAAGGGAGDLYAIGTVSNVAATITLDSDHADYGDLDAEILLGAVVEAYAEVKAEESCPIEDIAISIVGEGAEAELKYTDLLANGDTNNAWKIVIAGAGDLAMADHDKDATDPANVTGVTYNAATIADTANDIIALITNTPTVLALVSVAKAGSDSGAGAVTAMAKTNLTGGARVPAV